MGKKESPLVSIRCLVYNHGPYLRQCLDGFVMQKTNFAFEAIVHDDASTDNSAEIIREYAEKYPDIIKPIYETENQYSKKDGSLNRIMIEAIHPDAKYIAMCEGDDYWIDPLKLQKQVDFLEKNPDYVYSCHRYYIYNETDKTRHLAKNKYFNHHPDIKEFSFSLNYPFLNEWITKTLTCVYRREALDTNISSLYKYYRDVHLVYNILSKGKGICHSFIGGTYRQNPYSIFGSMSAIKQVEINYLVFSELYKKTCDPLFKDVLLGNYYSRIYHSKRIIKPQNKLEYEFLFKFPIFLIKKIVRLL